MLPLDTYWVFMRRCDAYCLIRGCDESCRCQESKVRTRIRKERSNPTKPHLAPPGAPTSPYPKQSSPKNMRTRTSPSPYTIYIPSSKPPLTVLHITPCSERQLDWREPAFPHHAPLYLSSLYSPFSPLLSDIIQFAPPAATLSQSHAPYPSRTTQTGATRSNAAPAPSSTTSLRARNSTRARL